MTVSYGVGVHENTFRFCRRHDHYFGLLGIGAGEWLLEDAGAVVDKLDQASACAWWHLREYENTVEKVLAAAS
jgi:hypothetical protein